MAAPQAQARPSLSAQQLNLLQAVLLYTVDASRGGRGAVTREDYIRNARKALGGAAYRDIKDAISKLQARNLASLKLNPSEKTRKAPPPRA